MLRYEFLRALPFLLIACAGATPYPKRIWDRLCEHDWISCGSIDPNGEERPITEDGLVLTKRGKVFAVLTTVGCVLCFVLCVAYLVDSTFSPFLYFIF